MKPTNTSTERAAGHTPKTAARTFKILSDLQSGTRDVVDAGFAQELELQNADLLKALIRLEEGVRLWISNPVEQADMEAARAAIAAATGGQP